ncbi:aminotransferase class IV [Salinarchaeum laminariae]|uniref:aminotransferase class IV n=1 Tax=Salinarchaeum laminariae TaxID=869888 RepID=UPI0020C0277D|nr:aminotransferase class IV [Salinarchaeum laminariae]
MSPQFNLDGEIVPAEEATVSVEDRGFQYGDGAFETLRAYGGDIFEWEAHADRLDRTCEALSIDHGIDRAELRERIDETIAANEFDDAYVKCSITRGVQPGKLTPDPDVDPTVVVYAKGLPRGGVDGESVWDDPATLQTVKTRRMPDSAIPASAKTHNYLNGILARAELIDTADEALLRDTEGAVVEGAASNVFFVHDDALHTPSATRDLLPGITRRVVIDLAEDAGVPVRTGTYEPSDVREAREAFLTNTTWELRPVDEVDGISVGGGAVTELLSRLFDELVEERHY